jgi:ribosome-associated toxin RatA of RatAB toxin-antitoxin module
MKANGSLRNVQASVELDIQPDKLWEAITDHEALPGHVSFLRQVKVLTREQGGVGTIRECTLRSGKSFTEKITAWEEGRLYCYVPDVSQAPFPFTWAQACWQIEVGRGGSRLTYRLQYQPKSQLRDLINYPLLRTYGVWQIRKMLRTYATRK